MRSNAVDFALRCLGRFLHVGGAQQATILGAQAFTSLIPFLVVAAAFSPDGSDLAQRIINRFGLEGESARSVSQLFANSGETQSAITAFSIAILVISGLSFTRGLQRLFQRAYDEPSKGLTDAWRGLAWLAGFAAWVMLAAPLRQSVEDVGGVVFAVIIATGSGCLVWLLTPMLLLGRRDWRRLAPGAAVSGFLGAVLGVASSIYVPVLMDWSAERYGLIGIAFALQSWLLVFAFVVVIGAVVGATVVEQIGGPSLRRRRERVR